MKSEHLGVYQDIADKNFYLCISNCDALFDTVYEIDENGVIFCSLSSKDARKWYTDINQPTYIGSLADLGERLTKELFLSKKLG